MKHQERPDHLRRRQALIDGLRPRHRYDPAWELKSKLLACGKRSRWRRKDFCRSPACPRCRDKHIKSDRKKLQAAFEGVPNDELAFVTIVIGVTRPNEVWGIAPIWDKFRQDIRNRLDRQKRKDPSWGPIRLVGSLEVDCYDVTDIPCLGSDKKKQIGELLGPVSLDASGPVWVITMHGFVHLGRDVSRGQFEEALRNVWSGHKQVQVDPFDQKRTPSANINRIVNYGLKFNCMMDLGDGRKRPWDMSWEISFFVFLQKFSRGFQSLKISYGMRKRKECDDVKDDVEDILDDCVGDECGEVGGVGGYGRDDLLGDVVGGGRNVDGGGGDVNGGGGVDGDVGGEMSETITHYINWGSSRSVPTLRGRRRT